MDIALVPHFNAVIGSAPVGAAYRAAIGPIERVLLCVTMEAFSGNMVQAARHLGLNRNTLRKRLLEHGIIEKRAQGRRRA